MNTVHSDARRDRLRLIRWYLLCDALMNEQATDEDIRFVDATVAKRTMTLWMRERMNDGPEIKTMIASRLDQSATFSYDELMGNIVPHGFLQFVQESSSRGKALRGIAGLLCDVDRLSDFIQVLYDKQPEWCRVRHPGDTCENDQMQREIATAMIGASYDDAVKQVLEKVSWSGNGSVDNPVANRGNDYPEYHP